VCDLREDRARAFARQFGAKEWTTDYGRVLADERIEAVSLVLNCDDSGRVRYPDLAVCALEAGKHVWIEKPPANSVEEVRRIIDAERAGGKRLACGLKKMFMPATLRVLDLIRGGRIGPPAQILCRYPQSFPPQGELAENPWALAGFRDHICHPTSIALRLAGRVRELMYIREDSHGGAMISLRFESGAIGHIHLCGGMGQAGPRERTEIVAAHGGHVIVDNNIDVHWYRDGDPRPYGRAPDFTCDPDRAAVHMMPEFSLGVLYNSAPFLLGYAFELNHFCDAIMRDTPFDAAGSADILHLTAIYEALITHPPGEWIPIDDHADAGA
jgi:predicted dehydrogenase